MSLYDKASLVLIPSGTKTSKVYSQKPTNGDGDFTFSRSTAATRVNASGNIEKETQNLLLQSNQFDTTWATANSPTLTSGQSGYDGSSDAWLLSKPAASFVNINQDISISGVVTYSVYLKAGTNSTAILRALGGTDNQFFIDLSNGTSTFASATIIDYVIEDVGSGWYRTSISVNDSGSVRFFIYPEAPFGNTTAGNIYIQDAQLEQGLVARDYIETTTTAIYGGITDNVPRLDYQGSCPALLLEPQRTNLVGFSEYTDGTNWSNEGSIVDEENTSETTSPEGYYNAVKLVSANATSEQWIQASGLNVTSTGDYTASCFVKKSDYDFFYIRFTGVGGVWGAGGAWFNINTGSVATTQSGVIADIVDYGNGWYRVSATKEAVGTAFGAIRFQLASSDGSTSVVGDGSKGTYAYGFQVEAGSYATSYIPTYGSAVTRNSEILGALTGLRTNEITTTGAYTIFFDLSQEPVLNVSDGNSNFLEAGANDSSFGNIIWSIRKYYQDADGKIRFYSNLDATTIGYLYSDNKKFCMVVNGTNVRLFTDGSKEYTYDGVNSHNGIGSIRATYGSADRTSTMFSSILIFPTALTDQEAIDLTTI